jgi:peroxiredoxin
MGPAQARCACLGGVGRYLSQAHPSQPARRDFMTIQIGDRIPEATFAQATAEGPKPVNTADVFAGKTVALFAVPGAFTPTCSARHLPGFKDNLDAFKGKGVDVVACLSVNDAFVMKAWAESQGVEDGSIVMLADGNGELTRALGLVLDGSGFGLGERSQRYSMLVKDGVVTELNIEQGGEFKVSSAEHLLAQL